MTQRLLLAAALAALTATAQAQDVVYQDVHAADTAPLRDERGLPRTPRLELGASFSYGVLSAPGLDPVGILGFGGRGAVLVPLGPYVLVGAHALYEQRTLIGPDIEAFQAEQMSSIADMGAVARARVIRGAFEAGFGVAAGPTRFAAPEGDEWGWFANPHIALRSGGVFAMTASVGLVYRSYPDSDVTELGVQAELGFSFLLWSYR
ncbi:MAG: hypothetical protein CMN30_27440 [Sandaracinus sp.]|nr:hypothetical protein [Sandaracinus sp.]